MIKQFDEQTARLSDKLRRELDDDRKRINDKMRYSLMKKLNDLLRDYRT